MEKNEACGDHRGSGCINGTHKLDVCSLMLINYEVWVSIPMEGELYIILEKMLTRDLQHYAMNTIRNGSHRTAQGDAVTRESL